MTDFGGKTDRVGGKGEVTTPYVLWVDVEITTNLESLVEKVKEKITSKYDLWYQMPQPYTPHVTIAFRDLTKEGYKKGKKYLEEISFKKFVQVSNIALVEKLPESDIEYKRFQFTSK